MSDLANAEAFALVNEEHLRYDHTLGQWFLWNDNHRWEEEDKGQVTGLIGDSLVAQGVKPDMKFINAVRSLAKDHKALALSGKEWDKDVYLLCTPTGVFDMRTGKVRPGTREDYLRLCTAVGYDENAPTPKRFLRHLEECITTVDGTPDYERIRYLQTFIGRCLCGDPKEHIYIVFFGEGRNGKGTILNIFKFVLGDYAAALTVSGIRGGSRGTAGGPRADMAKLEGKYFVVVSEGEKDAPIDDALLKSLVSKDTQSFRAPYAKKEKEWSPTFGVILQCNHPPVIRDDSKGMKGRLRYMTFRESFVGREDLGLEAAIAAEAPGILNWMIEGAIRYREQGGLDPVPESMQKDAEEFWKSRDMLNAWCSERGILEGDADWDPRKDEYRDIKEWYSDYQAFMEETNSKPVSLESFSKKLVQKVGGRDKCCRQHPTTRRSQIRGIIPASTLRTPVGKKGRKSDLFAA